ncbi:gamma-glutamyltransferase family protein [Methyloceanibacter sp.]|uniref:gamma-glutamyltransferase family protein n=1 Tax=Methyloceanibacter sp. TaxID=1965321 RepID=UPI002D6A46F0|nr:gamma-glutamyltransferase [Methyloceanibacter sp.]HZP10618.1 gamma-glutamyltransferase [Methyloceanibacter sp.]
MAKGNGVVAAGHELTARAAAEILEDGGNAFDAGLAAAFMTFVAEAVFASPGGGGFLMARRAGRDDANLLDFFAETPLKRRPESEVSFYPIHADFGPARQEFHIGLGASATPGVVPGLFAMHEALCQLPMKRLVEPAVRVARAGFPLTEFQAYLFTVIAPILTASPGVAAIFAPGGELMKAGATFRNEQLAETLEWLAEDGARLFVDGDVGQAIVAQSRDQGGYLTHDDLARYRVSWREPLYWHHAGATVALNPPPAASGALIAFGLGFLELLAGHGRAIDAEALCACMEAINEARAAHGEALASRLAAGHLAKELEHAARHPAAYRGTTHISVIDGEGNAAAVSLSNGEGNGHVLGKFGFMLNNMLGEEDLTSGKLGDWREGIRLSSMMAPTIILETDGTVTALGTGGSNRIRSAILQVAVNLLDRGLSLEEAVERPRLHVERDGKTSFEPGFSEREARGLLALGDRAHAWPEKNLFFGGVHAARARPKGAMEGAGDPRRQGVAFVV